MAIGSGLGSSFGFSVNEATYGTFTAPTKFVRARSYNVDKTATRQQGGGISVGQFGPLGNQFVETVSGGQATVAFDVQNRGLGVLLNTLMGGTVTPTIQGAGPAYLATFPLADTYGKFITVQSGVPIRSGTVIANSLSGCKVTELDLSCTIDGILQATANLDGKTYSSAQSYATPAYTSTAVFHGGQMAVKMGTFGSESAVSGVRSVGVKISRPHDTADYTAGSAGAKGEPVLNGWADITASLEVDFLAKATFQDLSQNLAGTSLVIEFVGALLNATFYDTFRVTLPGVYFEPGTQDVSGPGELTSTWNATWRFDGTNQPSITTICADTTL